MHDPNLCEKCGRCCYAKLIIDGQIVYTPFPCPYLDEQTRLCTVYERRHELNPQCMPVEMGIQMGVFPADCPYVREIPGYTPPRMELTGHELEAYADAVRAIQSSILPQEAEPGGD
ncbi:MAG: hypothetical protein ACLF0G_02215 [Candidatus Brocadiia bacterium]